MLDLLSMVFRHRLFKLPSPVELGWSEYNALGLREWNEADDKQDKTWEDWHEHVKKEYPVRYFFGESLPTFVRFTLWFPIWAPIDRAWYWLASHVIPSRRFHVLDLRQPNGEYDWGYQELDTRMLYAIFNILKMYIEETGPVDLSKEDLEANPECQPQQDKIDEARALYTWWTKTRHEDKAATQKLREEWWAARTAKAANKEELWARLREADDAIDDKEDEMVLRLMKIRRTLWT